MREEQISSGSITILQGVIVGIGVIVTAGLGYLYLSVDLDTTANVILLFILAFIFILIYRVYKFADLYKLGNQIVYKRLFQSRVKNIQDIKYIDEGFLPLNYYIVFKDETKVYFQISVVELGKKIFNSQDSTLAKLYALFDLNYEKGKL